MLFTVLDTFNAIWPWLGVAAGIIFGIAFAIYQFNSHIIPRSAILDPLLAALTSTLLTAAVIFEPRWADDRLILTLAFLTFLSCLHIAEWFTHLESYDGPDFSARLYISNLVTAMSIYAGSFLLAALWFAFPSPTT